jgi:small-conductance mechanosensitive channel
MKESSNQAIRCFRRPTEGSIPATQCRARGNYWIVPNVLFFIFVAFSEFAVSQKAPQAPPPASSPTPAPEQAIPLPLVSSRAEELGRLLREIEKRLVTEQDLGSLEDENQARDREIREKVAETDDLITGVPKLLELRELQWYWRVQRVQQSVPLNQLTRQASALEKDLLVLNGQKANWEVTLKQIQGQDSFKTVADLIQSSLADIRSMQSRVRTELSLLLKLQNRFSVQDRMIADVLDRISEARNQFQTRLLQRDSPTLWGAWSRGSKDPVGKMLHQSVSREVKSSKKFTQTNTPILAGFLIILALALFVTLALKRSTSGRTEPQVQIFQRPGSIALLTTVLVCFVLLPAAPVSVVSLMGMLCLIPLLRLLPPLVKPTFRLPLYWLLGFCVAVEAERLIEAAPYLERTLQAVVVTGAIVLLARLGQLLRADPVFSTGTWRMLVPATHGALVLLILSLACNVGGYFGLSRVLGEATILSCYAAIVLYTVVRILTSLVWLALQTRRAQRLISVRWHGKAMSRAAGRFFVLVAVLVWLTATLDLFTVRHQIVAFVASTLKVSISLGKVSFSVGDVLAFVLILIVGFLCASLIRFILREEVLSRIPLQRGLPNAISTLAHYLVLLLVFLLALAGAGVDFSRFALLTGAFGVGIGFGLQTVVNNFVSGLILLFERHINVGDTVELGNVSGEITRIGIRSSTLRTFQGSEILVPNANLVSNQVTNWTLSDLRRRVDLPVGVAYGTDIERVLSLLVNVAQSHPEVLRDPEPVAVFQGFGDSSLNFELRFWSPHIQIHLRLKNEIAVAIAKALEEAEIEIPFPQRDLHIKEVNASAKEGKEMLGRVPREPSDVEKPTSLAQSASQSQSRRKEGESL